MVIEDLVEHCSSDNEFYAMIFSREADDGKHRCLLKRLYGADFNCQYLTITPVSFTKNDKKYHVKINVCTHPAGQYIPADDDTGVYKQQDIGGSL